MYYNGAKAMIRLNLQCPACTLEEHVQSAWKKRVRTEKSTRMTRVWRKRYKIKTIAESKRQKKIATN